MSMWQAQITGSSVLGRSGTSRRRIALIERCAAELHLVQGVLRLLEIYGAALLAEEMEFVAAYLKATAAGDWLVPPFAETRRMGHPDKGHSRRHSIAALHRILLYVLHHDPIAALDFAGYLYGR